MSFRPLVSLIIPCYNIANISERFFNSLINQTYTHIQLIFVNDGSTDETEQKLFFYKSTLENKGYIFDYYYQENKGLGGAINTGLKHIKGDYFCWGDPDDYFELDAFEVRIDYLEKNRDCAVLEADAYERDIDNLDDFVLTSSHYATMNEPKQFDLMLNYKSNFTSGCHMVLTKAFEKVNPTFDIYEAKRGQNWQLLLPVYHEFNRCYLDKPVYNCINYPNSMSHSQVTYEDYIKRYCENGTIQSETIKRMLISDEEKESLLNHIEIMTNRLYMYAAMSFKQKDDFIRYYKFLKIKKDITFKDYLRKIKLLLLS